MAPMAGGSGRATGARVGGEDLPEQGLLAGTNRIAGGGSRLRRRGLRRHQHEEAERQEQARRGSPPRGPAGGPGADPMLDGHAHGLSPAPTSGHRRPGSRRARR